jgi:inhibitor of growth protein 3
MSDERERQPKTRRAAAAAAAAASAASGSGSVKGSHYLRTQQQQQHQHQSKPIKTEIFPGLNDVTDAFEALPLDIIRYFTLLKEIDAKCVSVVPLLNSKIKSFKALENTPALKEKRTVQIREISKLIKDLLPCLEEKMHVASIAADKVVTYTDRINDDFELIFKTEIPDTVKFGPLNHPAIINDAKIPDNKSAQSQRSESRKEALAAKKAAHGEGTPEAGANGYKKESTPGGASSVETNNTNTHSTFPSLTVPGGNGAGSTANTTPTTTTATTTTTKKRKTASSGSTNSNATTTATAGGDALDMSRPSTPSSTAPKRRTTKKKQQLVSTTSSANVTGGSGGPNSAVSAAVSVVSSSVTGGIAVIATHPGASGVAGSNSNTNSNTNAASGSVHNNQTLENVAGGGGGGGVGEKRVNNDEPVYCYCSQVSYGEMVGCDGADCKREWFHLPCTGLATLPKGKWYCDDCNAKLKKARRV